jgi:uncharacterized cupin superfamily protein
MVVPVSDADVVAMQLDEYGPLKPSVGIPLDGPMTTSGKVFYKSDDEKIMTGVWECTAGRMRADFGNGGEMVHVVKGTIRALGDDGDERVVGPGESATFPPFWKGIWVLDQPMRKLYCVFNLDNAETEG